MKFSFSAKIYKVGINPCVDVPLPITEKMVPAKGYIPVKGKIKAHLFTQTLVPIKNASYRLYVNGPMLKGANAKVGDELKFIIEQDLAPITAEQIPMPKELKKQLTEKKLLAKFKALTPYRQKEILRYLNYLKTEEAVLRNVEKVVAQLNV
ncbi:MAG: YdeI/OmpD-associated family protein [Ferruginibacter sp.]